MTATRQFRAAILALAATACLAATPASASEPSEQPAFDRQAWLDDYAGLKAAMAQGYANLDWIEAHRGLDLAALDGRITARLEAATSAREALEALKDFIAAFHDPHLAGLPGEAPEAALRNSAGLPPPEDDSEDGVGEPVSGSCADLGYAADTGSGAFDPAALPGWSALASPDFAAGTAGPVAIIRIPSFREQDYPAACAASWEAGRSARETQIATRAVLQAELARLAEALQAGGAEILLLDVTGNGGGSEWSEEAASLFTAHELTRPAPLPVEPKCDRSAVWRGEPACSNLAEPGEVDRLPGLGHWRGPLAVLVDHRSASAAEDFAYWLKGSGAALLVGERTFGAGCGYMDGGRAFQLRAIAGYVKMPNCSRYTAEGINQIEGLAPDIPLDWAAADGPGLRALLEGLPRQAQ